MKSLKKQRRQIANDKTNHVINVNVNAEHLIDDLWLSIWDFLFMDEVIQLIIPCCKGWNHIVHCKFLPTFASHITESKFYGRRHFLQLLEHLKHSRGFKTLKIPNFDVFRENNPIINCKIWEKQLYEHF